MTVFLLCGFLASGTVLSLSCATNRTNIESVPQQSMEIKPAATPEPPDTPATSPSPSPAEVREAITRVYREVLMIDTKRDQYFTTGDFNGDGYQDLAVTVKPVDGKIEAINSEFANWTIQDVTENTSHSLVSKSRNIVTQHPELAPPKVNQKDDLLAVINGYGRSGWRDSAARQTYLLKNAVGGNVEVLSPTVAREIVKGKRRFPWFRGDVIKNQLAGKVGLLYWSGANYIWRPLGSQVLEGNQK